MERVTTAQSVSSSCAIRPYESADRPGFRSLYEAVWGTVRPAAWFEWRFSANPYADRVRISVAETDDTVVGVAGAIPYRIRAGEETVTALQPVDWLVHPDFRGQGLATRLARDRIERDRDAALYFNFPTAALEPLLDNLGWRTVGTQSTWYRVQRPLDLLGATPDSRVTRHLHKLCSATASKTLDAVDWLHRGTPSDVERHENVCPEALSACYRADPPDEFHVRRDEPFYRWRYANPLWNARSYAVRADGDPIAGLVAFRYEWGGTERAVIADVVPRSDVPPAPLRALFDAALSDLRDVTLVKASDELLPPRVLRRRAFVSDATTGCDRFVTPTTMVARPLSADGWTIGGMAIDEPANWSLAFGDRDLA